MTPESILFNFSRTAAWRLSRHGTYPEDTRNFHAANLLQKFAQTPVHDIRPDLRKELEDLVDSPRRRETFNAAAREVGFRLNPPDVNVFLDCILDRISDTIH